MARTRGRCGIFRPLLAALPVTLGATAHGQTDFRSEIESGLAAYTAEVSRQRLVNLDPSTDALAAWDASDRNATSALLSRLKRAGALNPGNAIFLGDDALIGNLVLPVDIERNDIATQSATILNFLVDEDPYRITALLADGGHESVPRFGWALQDDATEGESERGLNFIQTADQVPIVGAEASITVNNAARAATSIYLSVLQQDEIAQVPSALRILENAESRRQAREAAASAVDTEDGEWLLQPFILRTSTGLRPVFVLSDPETTEAGDRSSAIVVVDAESNELWLTDGSSSRSTPRPEDDESCETMPFRDISGYQMQDRELITGFMSLLCESTSPGEQSTCVFGTRQVFSGPGGESSVRVVVKDGFRDENDMLCGRYVDPTEITTLSETRIYKSALETLTVYAKYLYEQLDWCGLDGSCKTIQALIFDEDELDYAKFDHATASLFFGNSREPNTRHTALNPSVIGHELMHGIVRERTSPRVVMDACINKSGEEFGALEESLGDIAGTLLHAAVFAEIDPDSLSDHGGLSRWGRNEFGDIYYRDFERPFKQPVSGALLPQPDRFPPTGDYSTLTRTQLLEAWRADGGPQPEHYNDRLIQTCRDSSLVPYVNSGIPNKLGFLLMTARSSSVPEIRSAAEAASFSNIDWLRKLLRVYFELATDTFRCKNFVNCDDFCSFRTSHQFKALELFDTTEPHNAVGRAFDLVGIPAGGSCP